jgi:hypothetical protein
MGMAALDGVSVGRDQIDESFLGMGTWTTTVLTYLLCMTVGAAMGQKFLTSGWTTSRHMSEGAGSSTSWIWAVGPGAFLTR